MATALLKLTDVQLGTSVTATNNFTMYQPASPDGTVRWGVGNSGSVTDIVTLSSAGNMGLGITANANLRLQVQQAVDSTIGGIGVTSVDGTKTSVVSELNTGDMTFRNTGSERMRIDTNGNVGIGTTSPLNLLSVYSTGNANIGIRSDTSASQTIGQYSTNTTASQLTLYKSRGTQASQSAVATGDSVGTLWFTAYGGTNNRQVSYITSAISDYTSDTNISSYLAFGTDSAGTGAGERMRIDSGGNVGIGTSSPQVKLHVYTGASGNNYNAYTTQIRVENNGNGGLSIHTPAANQGIIGHATPTDGSSASIVMDGTNRYMAFCTVNGTERMRIDSSGNVSVGYAGSVAARLYSKGSTADSTQNAIAADNSSGTVLLRVRNDGVIYTGSATYSPYNNTTGVAANMVVGSGGDLYRSTSSIKYKTDVKDATHGLAELLKLRPVTYKGKNDGDTVFGGLIAEEVDAAGLKEFVQYAEDGTPDALAYSNMVSLCVKAIQELTARVIELEKK